MSEILPEYCDNKSVGVIIENEDGAIALLQRARFPVGIAPPAGHIDAHGSPEEAAVAEVGEELGIVVAIEGLRKTIIEGRRIDNLCRRVGGDHHEWWVFEANEPKSELKPSPDETKSAGWHDRTRLQELAKRTRAFRAGRIPEAEWEADPGLEELWLDFFVELGYVE